MSSMPRDHAGSGFPTSGAAGAATGLVAVCADASVVVHRAIAIVRRMGPEVSAGCASTRYRQRCPPNSHLCTSTWAYLATSKIERASAGPAVQIVTGWLPDRRSDLRGDRTEQL